MTFLTEFADQAVILPLAMAVALLLAAGFWWRGAIAWIACVGGTLGTIGVGKLVLAACGPLHFGDVLQSPSGHTASATIVYGGLLGLAWRHIRPAQNMAPISAALAIAVVIGITRVVLNTHSWPEVVVGGWVGCVGVWLLLALAGQPPSTLRPARLAVVVMVIVALMHGTHLRAEANIQELGRRFAWLVPGCDASAAQVRP